MTHRFRASAALPIIGFFLLADVSGAALARVGGGSCQSELDCDDGNACTLDTCDENLQCVTTPVVDGSPCDDGNACTVSDTCASGSCGSASFRGVVSAGGLHTCAIRNDSRLACWGVDGEGRVSGPNASTATYLAVSAGQAHTCALGADDHLACWGVDGDGRVTGPNESAESYRSVSAGDGHTCALRSKGNALCWGRNDRMQLGGAGPSGPKPRAIAQTEGALSILKIWLR